ncbi:MAG: [Fe-Fe] hydrogenase large subunit C-terminal domain-containing protein [Bacteroidota bacterium]
MEPLLKIRDEKCIACYACVRACPVKAIQVRSDREKPEILPNRCIGCGNCLATCSPGAIEIRDSRTELKLLLSGKEKVAAIVDPSIAGEFPDITDYRKFVQMMRRLGFSYVNEVSFGVDLVAARYRDLFAASRGKYYIMANCPITVSYIAKYRPELIPNLAPIIPPSVATAKVARELYGPATRIVYISPLIASKEEAVSFSDKEKIDCVITFVELRELFEEYRIDEKELEYSDFDPPLGYRGALFPLAGGILEAADLFTGRLDSKVVTIEGNQIFDAIDEFADSINIIKLHFNLFYKEFLMGRGTSMGGKRSLRRSQMISYVNKRLKKFDHQEWEKAMEKFSSIGFDRHYTADEQRLPEPPEDKLEEILKELHQRGDNKVGCGACGYRSCHDFAVAIAQGLAIPEMCNNYATLNRQNHIQALKISNEKLAQAQEALRESEKNSRREKESARESSEIIKAMLQKLHSSVLIVDENLKIIQANQSFIELLGDEAREINEVVPGLTGADLKTLLPYNLYNLFTFVLSNNEDITNRDVTFDERMLNISVFVIRKAKIVGAVIRDMSIPAVQKEEVVKRLTEVVDKNLHLVQQIGFILGEGAAETERMLNAIIESYKPRKKH